MTSRKRKSKKPSATKASPAKLLEKEVFFVDRSGGKYDLPNALERLGLNIERHDDHFPEITIDVEWILYCGEKNWIIVSGDKAIKRNSLEKQAIMFAKVAAFFYTSNSISGKKQAEAFTIALPAIQKLIVNQEKPFIARISPDGTVELWLNHKGEDCIQQKIERRKQNKIRKRLNDAFDVNSFTDDE